jgi:hypothetical protein
MLQRCREQQEVVVRIKNALADRGYSCWLDVEQMSGSTVDAMADAIDHSYAVVYGISLEYKESANCRLEAMYAHQAKVQMIPLLLQENYTAKGWLGMLLGTQLWYGFFGATIATESTFTKQIDQLCRPLGSPDRGQRAMWDVAKTKLMVPGSRQSGAGVGAELDAPKQTAGVPAGGRHTSTAATSAAHTHAHTRTRTSTPTPTHALEGPLAATNAAQEVSLSTPAQRAHHLHPLAASTPTMPPSPAAAPGDDAYGRHTDRSFAAAASADPALFAPAASFAPPSPIRPHSQTSLSLTHHPPPPPLHAEFGLLLAHARERIVVLEAAEARTRTVHEERLSRSYIQESAAGKAAGQLECVVARLQSENQAAEREVRRMESELRAVHQATLAAHRAAADTARHFGYAGVLLVAAVVVGLVALRR